MTLASAEPSEAGAPRHAPVLSLSLTGVTKSFDGFRALDAASFQAARGEVHALLGENGAGKSSLMNVVAGHYAPDAGRMEIDGVVTRLSGPAQAAALGIGMVHQHFKLVRPFTVAENILLANPRGGYRRGLAAIRAEIAHHAAALGFDLDPDQRIETLSIAERQRVEIVKVLIGGARILILDEPTAVLTDEEAARLLDSVRALARGGATVVLVTHKLADVKTFADRVTVMRGGRTIATLDPAGVSATELTTLTVGEAIAAARPRAQTAGPERLAVGDLSVAGRDGRIAVADAGFAVRGGEIYGIAGVGGNGQSELAAALLGLAVPSSGWIRVEGAEELPAMTPRLRRHHAIAAIPADRFATGLAAALSVTDNLAVGSIADGRFGGWLRVNRSRMRRAARAAIKAFDVQGVRGLDQKAALLSGGNAQKLLIARELGDKPSIIVAHSPSRGLDARACAAVHARLVAARAEGAAVLLISEDLDEVLGLSDRVGVMTRGRIVAEQSAPFDRQAIGQAMVDHA